MGRKRKKFNKIYILDDFLLDIDIYKKRVVFFHIDFNVSRDTNGQIKTDDLNHQLELVFNEKFKNLKGRKILDINTGEYIRGYVSHIQMSAYLEMFENYEDYIVGRWKELIPLITEIFNKKGFKIKELTAKKNVARNTRF